jgi:hypothetical protein
VRQFKIYPIDLLPCPFCGNTDELTLKIQTPICDDGRHRDAYIRCFECGARGPYISFDLSTQEVGQMPMLPILEQWNKRDT